MLRIRMSDEEREGRERFRGLDMAAYTKKSFGMFGGREEQVKLLVHNRLAGVIIDRFGKDIMMIPADEEHFTVHVDVAVSGQFISWVFSLGDEVKILGRSLWWSRYTGRYAGSRNSTECEVAFL